MLSVNSHFINLCLRFKYLWSEGISVTYLLSMNTDFQMDNYKHDISNYFSIDSDNTNSCFFFYLDDKGLKYRTEIKLQKPQNFSPAMNGHFSLIYFLLSLSVECKV